MRRRSGRGRWTVVDPFSVRCPYCMVDPQLGCRTLRLGRPCGGRVHAARVRAARESARERRIQEVDRG